MTDFSHLNDAQKTAVLHLDGPALVIAGAGTGKTRVITERIAHLITSGTCKNSEILSLTFTDKAANEMETRLDQLMPIGYEAVSISTFHSFCEKVLRRYGIDIGISPGFKVLQGVYQWQFLSEHLFEFDLSYYRPLGNPTKFIDALLKHFGRLKEELISPDDAILHSKTMTEQAVDDEMKLNAERFTETAYAYHRYQELLSENNYLDFSDLQMKVIELLKRRPNILAHLQRTYKYLMIDEYQDTNFAQNSICDLLAEKSRNLMVVGDDDQSIYKFRGAAISNILQFQERYPDLKKIVLTKNYRSSQQILDFSYVSIQKNNPDRLEVKAEINKQLTAERPGSPDDIVLTHCASIDQEVDSVVQKIKDAKVPFSEIALLVRANHYAHPFIDAFKKHQIPYQFLSERGLYDKNDVKQLICVLRFLSNPTDDISFYQILRMPFWAIKMELIVELMTLAKRRNVTVWQEFKKASLSPLLLETFTDLFDYSKDHTAGEVLYRFANTIHLYDYYLKEGTVEAEEKIVNVAAFFRKLHDFERQSEHTTVIDFVTYLDLAIESGDNPSASFDLAGQDGVQVSSIHGVKGLEFNTVFVVNLSARRFPSDNRQDLIPVPDGLIHELLSSGEVHQQEERRLFYVACTRAKEKLFLSHSDYYGVSFSKNPRASKRSLFLEEVIESFPLTQEERTAKESQPFTENEPVQAEVAPVHFEPPKITSFSYSQLSTFQKCPRQYQYGSIYKIPQPPSAALSFGITLHNTLLEFYKLVLQTKQASLFTEFEDQTSLAKLHELYQSKWVSVGYESKAHLKTAFERGKEILNKFYDHFKEDVTRIEFLEKGFRLKLGDYVLNGRIDRADRTEDGSLEIIDYKTGRAKTQKEMEKDMQLKIYALAALECFSQTASKLTLYFLDDDLKLSTEPDFSDFEAIKAEIIHLADAINASDFSPTPSKITCSYCAYRGICDAAI